MSYCTDHWTEKATLSTSLQKQASTFRKNWQRDTRVAGRRVSNKDMEKIKEEVAALLHDTFKEELEADDGYPMVEKPDTDVLLLRPAIIASTSASLGRCRGARNLPRGLLSVA